MDKIILELPQPVILLRGNYVEAFNPSAEALLPELARGADIAELLGRDIARFRELPFLAYCFSGGRLLSVWAQSCGERIMLTLSHKAGLHMPDPAYSAALSGTASTIGSSSEIVLSHLRQCGGAGDDYAKILRHSACLLQRLSMHTGIVAGQDLSPVQGKSGWLDLAQLCRMAIDASSTLLPERTLRFSVQGPERLQIYGNAEDTRRMVLNLLSNSIKYTPDGGQITLDYQSDGQTAVVVTVTDTGRGMDRETMMRLWSSAGEPAHDALTPDDGAHLGLAVTAILCARQHGTVILHSAEGAGVTARVWLPSAAPENTTVRERITDYELSGNRPYLTELSDVLSFRRYDDETMEG